METLTFLFTTSFYPPYHVGGACVHVKYLAEELARRGHEVHIMHSLDAYEIKRGKSLVVPDEEADTRIHVHTLKSRIRALDPLIVYTLGASSFVRKNFYEIVSKIHPDVVHHHNISLLGYNILRKSESHLSIYTAHDYWLICSMNNLLRNRKEICTSKSCYSCAIRSLRPPQIWRSFRSFRTAISSLDLLIAPSHYVRKTLAQQIEVKSVTMPNFVPYPPENILSATYSGYFLFAGMLEAHKGILNLIELFKESGNEIDAKLVIAGTGSLKNRVEKFIEKNSLSEQIFYIGFAKPEKLYALYKSALAVIVPSICPENAPLVALESLSVGTPIIASNLGGLPEIVEKVDKRLIFSDYFELKDILLDFSKKEFSSKKITDVYEENFSPKAYVEKYIETIRNIGV